jgi:hypothetical protein
MSTAGTSLKDLVKKFNTDDDFREKFLNDPVGQLQGLGWTMPDSQKQELRDLASDLASQIRDSAKNKYTIDLTGGGVTVRPEVRI